MKSPDEKKSPGFLGSPTFTSFFKRSPRRKHRSLGTAEDLPAEWRSQSEQQLATASSLSPPPLKKPSKSFPRSMSMLTSSDTSTLLNPMSPSLALRNLDPETETKPWLLGGLDENRQLMRSVRVAGVSVLLGAKQLSKPISLKLIVNGDDFVKLPLRYDHIADPAATLRWEIQPHLTIRANTSLTFQLRRRRGWPKSPIFAEASVTFEEAVEAIQASVSQDDVTTYQLILREDPAVIIDLVAESDSLQANLNLAKDKARELRSVLSHLGKSRDFLQRLIAYGSAISEIDPFAKAALGCVRVLWKQLEEREKIDRTVIGLAEDMARTLSYIEDVEQFARLTQLRKALEEVIRLMEETTNFIIKYTNRTLKEKVIDAPFFEDDIEALRKKFDVFKQQFDRGLAVQGTGDIDWVVKYLASAEDNRILETLRPRGFEVARLPPPCMDGTRRDVFGEIDEWLDDLKAPNILWIRGFPGVGKSSIASTVMMNLYQRNRLGSKFIFEREKATVLTPNVLWRNVAYDLARLYPSIRKVILEKLKDEDLDLEYIETSNVKALFRELIEEPIGEQAETDPIPPGRFPVVVIDAVDECGGRGGVSSDDRRRLLSTIARWKTLPPEFKLIITSRIEQDIENKLADISEVIDLSLGKNSPAALQDIRLFFEKHLSKIASKYESLPQNWPGDTIRDRLTERAAGLFLWAKTAIQYINLGEPVEQLNLLLEGTSLGDMAVLYTTVLEWGFPQPSETVLETFRQFVGAMIFAKEPLTKQQLRRLLPCEPTMFDHVLRGIDSVLDPWNMASGILTFSHESFIEFLLDSNCPENFRVDQASEQENMARFTLAVMVDELRFNITGFGTSHTKNAAVEGLEDGMKATTLGYACRFWMHHVQAIPWDEDIFEQITIVILDKFLFWLEVLSACGSIYDASVALEALRTWCGDAVDEEFLDFVEDALKFLDAFSGAMHHSLPHIYISALPFAPSNSKIAQRFRRYFPRTVHIEENNFMEWPRVVFTVEEHDGAVNCAAFSPDGKLIASGSSDRTVIVCDAENGDIRTGPMEGHEGYVGAIAFSQNGKFLASGSDDCTVKIWDTESGDLIADLKDASGEHECAVTSIVFLSTEENHPWRLASSYFDGCIRIWDVSEAPDSDSFGQLLQILSGHKGGVTTIAYSPDGTKIASGSVDRSIRIWDASTGEPLHDEPFEGHMNCVTSVAFSPDGLRLASASEDETIQIWELDSGTIAVGPLEGHTEAVTSIAWSPDGTRLVSGSLDGILILWNSENGNIICEPFTGHKSGVTSVAFSPRGHRILSSSMDRSLRVWDAEIESDGAEPESGPEPYTLKPFLDFPAHQDNLKSVAFSPDGLRIVSGSDDETIRLWDAETGEPVHETRFHRQDLDGHHWHRFPQPPSHSKGVDVVAYSPDGVLIASGGATGGDGEVCIWDSDSGELLQPVLRGHTGGITTIHFLPDDNLLVSSSHDRTIRVWDTHTGETVVGPLTPHTGWITSVAVSPDGTKIAAASTDGTICILDALTGEELGERLASTNDGSVNCIAFDTQDPTRLLAASTYTEYDEDDKEIHTHSLTLWGLESGDRLWGLEDAHHDVILCLAVSPNGRYAASGSADETIKIWDLSTGSLVLGPLEGHTGTIFSIAFNRDGTRLVSGSGDEAIRVWDVSSVGDIRGCFVGARPAEFSDNAGYRNGWIVKSRRELEEKECLLLWVPPWCRSGIWWPRNTAVISEVSVKLDLRTFVHGERWFECYDPHVDS